MAVGGAGVSGNAATSILSTATSGLRSTMAAGCAGSVAVTVAILCRCLYLLREDDMPLPTFISFLNCREWNNSIRSSHGTCRYIPDAPHAFSIFLIPASQSANEI